MNAEERYKLAITTPSDVYHAPSEVLADADMSESQKIEILKRWHDIQRGLMRATGEGMPEGDRSCLDDVVSALLKLGADPGDTA